MVRGEQRFTCMLRTGEAMSARDLLQGLTNNRAGVASLRARHRPGHCELGGRTQMETRQGVAASLDGAGGDRHTATRAGVSLRPASKVVQQAASEIDRGCRLFNNS